MEGNYDLKHICRNIVWYSIRLLAVGRVRVVSIVERTSGPGSALGVKLYEFFVDQSSLDSVA